jgi:hypothetical protein
MGITTTLNLSDTRGIYKGQIKMTGLVQTESRDVESSGGTNVSGVKRMFASGKLSVRIRQLTS